MKQLNNLLDNFLTEKGTKWQLKLRAEWPDIMGDLSRRARLERVVGTTVIIGVYDSHWLHELHALSRMILQRINNALISVYPENFVLTNLRCIWVQQKQAKKNNKVAPETKQYKQACAPSAQAQARVEKLKSQELQQALLDFYVRCKQEYN